jgi:ribosome-associated protein
LIASPLLGRPRRRVGSERGTPLRAPGLHEPRKPPIEAKTLAAFAAQLADAKKGVDIRVFDVSQHIKVADYFVLVSGHSRPHVKAMYEEIHVRAKAQGETHARAEGTDLGWWVLMDYGDVVIHILQPEAREYYALDQLYGDCPEVDWRAVSVPPAAAAAG